MSLAKSETCPLNQAIIEYCRSFLGRSLMHSWRELPIVKRGRGRVFQPLMQSYFECLNEEFMGQLHAAQWLKSNAENTVETLDRLEMLIVRTCSDESVESLVVIHKTLNSSSQYNELAFDPRNLVAYLVIAAKKVGLNTATVRLLSESYAKDLSRRVSLFYATLREVVEGYCAEASVASSLATNSDRFFTGDLVRTASVVKDRSEQPTPISPVVYSNASNALAEYIDRFYTSKLYAHRSPSILYTVYQSAYAHLICYTREGSEAESYKSEIVRQILQELYEFTEWNADTFDDCALCFSQMMACWAELDMGCWSSLRAVCDQLLQVKKSIKAKQLPAPDALPVRQVVPAVPEYAKTSYTYNCTQSIISAALEEALAPQISAFIDKYWRHALLVAGLQSGVESQDWNIALSGLQGLCNLTSLAGADDQLQDLILAQLRAVGLYFLSYNDFLEQGNYIE